MYYWFLMKQWEVMTLSEERKLKHRIFTTLEINNMDY